MANRTPVMQTSWFGQSPYIIKKPQIINRGPGFEESPYTVEKSQIINRGTLPEVVITAPAPERNPKANTSTDISKLTDDQIASMIIARQGGFGDGAQRKTSLGERYAAIQALINQRLRDAKNKKATVEREAPIIVSADVPNIVDPTLAEIAQAKAQAAAQIGVPTESGVERITGFVTPDEIAAEMVRRAEWDKNVSEMYDLPISSVTPEQLAMGAVRTESPASKTISDFSSNYGANTGKNLLDLSGDESRSDITSAANLALKENQDIYTSMLSANRKNYKGIKAGLKAEKDKQLAGAKDKSSKKEVKKNYSEEKSKARQEKRDQRRRLRSGHKSAAKGIREKADAARKNTKE